MVRRGCGVCRNVWGGWVAGGRCGVENKVVKLKNKSIKVENNKLEVKNKLGRCDDNGEWSRS